LKLTTENASQVSRLEAGGTFGAPQGCFDISQDWKGGCAAFIEAPSRGPVVSEVQMDIKEHMDVIGADGVHIGTVDRMEGGRIKLTKKDSGEGSHKGHHHFIDKSLVAGVEGNKVRLSANANVAVTMEQEK
jgi:hypothetical protein